jgi:4-amino-4-deoxyprephenate dehydrogenase
MMASSPAQLTERGAQMDLSNALVVGVNGGVGQLIAQNLMQSGVSVCGLDLNQQREDLGVDQRFLCDDILIPKAASVAAVRESDCIVLCVPARVALGCLDWIICESKPDSLIVDTLSVKTEVAKRVETIEKNLEYLSINPLFAPGLGFVQRNVAAVSIRGGALSSRFIRLIESWGAVVLPISAEMHDRSMSAIQVATHFMLIAYGLVLQKLGYDPGESHKLWTPPHALVLCLLARLLSSPPDVYWDIQKSNPFAQETRGLFIQVMEELNSTIRSDSQHEFSSASARLRSLMGSDLEVLARTCSEIVSRNLVPG